MNPVWNMARKEFSDGLRNRWLLAISLLFAVLAIGIAWLGAAASGQLGFTSVPATVASLSSLATFLMPLIALLLAYDAIVGEDESGTLLLLLTYPLGRGQLLLEQVCRPWFDPGPGHFHRFWLRDACHRPVGGRCPVEPAALGLRSVHGVQHAAGLGVPRARLMC